MTPIPDLDDDGFLPPGIYETTIEVIRTRFGQFQNSDQRCLLTDRLAAFLAEVKFTNLVSAVIVNGSYISGKDVPNDIDMILVLKSGHDFAAELRPFEYNAISRRQVQRRFGFDVLVAEADRPELVEYIEFFAQVRGQPGRQKGLLKVSL